MRPLLLLALIPAIAFAECEPLAGALPETPVNCQEVCERTPADAAYLRGRCATSVSEALAGYRAAVELAPWHFGAQAGVVATLAKIPGQEATVAGLRALLIENPSTPAPMRTWLAQEPERTSSGDIWLKSVWLSTGYDSRPGLTDARQKGSPMYDLGVLGVGIMPRDGYRLVLTGLATHSTLTGNQNVPGVTRQTTMGFGSVDYLHTAGEGIQPGLMLSWVGSNSHQPGTALTQWSLQPRLELGALKLSWTEQRRRQDDGSVGEGRGPGASYTLQLGNGRTLTSQASWLTTRYSGPQEGVVRELSSGWTYLERFDTVTAQVSLRAMQHNRPAGGIFVDGERYRLTQLEGRLSNIFGVQGLQVFTTYSSQTSLQQTQAYSRLQTGLQYTVNW